MLFASEVSSAFADRGEYGGASSAVVGTSHATIGSHAEGRASSLPKYLPASGDKAPGCKSHPKEDPVAQLPLEPWLPLLPYCIRLPSLLLIAASQRFFAFASLGIIASGGATWETGWCAVRDAVARRWLAGGFAWSGFDYRGEPFGWDPTGGPSTSVAAVKDLSAWPFVLSRFGLLDYAGFEKDGAAFYRALALRDASYDGPSRSTSRRTPVSARHGPHDGERRPHMVHLLPHWTWKVGQIILVRAYSSADVVELLLNERSLGLRTVSACQVARWEVPFERGELVARAFLSNVTSFAVASAAVRSAGKPAALAASVEWPMPALLRADGHDVAVLTVAVVDAVGVLVPDASVQVDVTLHGPGRLLSLASGDPASHQADRPRSGTGGVRNTWHGLLRIVVQAGRGHSGKLTLHASADALTSANATVSVRGVDGFTRTRTVAGFDVKRA